MIPTTKIAFHLNFNMLNSLNTESEKENNLSLRCSGVKPSSLDCLVFPPALA